jgi:hypothetical protein
MNDARATHALIGVPAVTETPLVLEPVTRDPFLDGLDTAPTEPGRAIDSRFTGSSRNVR